MKLLATDFDPPGLSVLLEKAPLFPVLGHVYGEPFPVSSDVHWMSYEKPNNENSIMFLKNVHQEFPEFVRYTTEYLESLVNFRIIKEYVKVLKTSGNIKGHVDEGRCCSINIGLKNTSVATTFSSRSKDYRTWKLEAVRTVCQDRHAYLIDTESIHSVLSNVDTPRYLVSYGFYETYDHIESLLRGDRHGTGSDLH